MAAALCLGGTACGDDEASDARYKKFKQQSDELERYVNDSLESDMEGRDSESEKEKNDAVEEKEIPEIEAPETEVPKVDFAWLEAQATKSGSCGDNVNWYLIGDELVIAGIGDMYEYIHGVKMTMVSLVTELPMLALHQRS